MSTTVDTPIDIPMDMSMNNSTNSSTDIPMEQCDGRWVLPEQAFYEKDDLETITLPEGLEVICAAAFAGCTSLTQIRLPSTLQEIGEGAFLGCISLEEITLPGALTSICDMAFWGSGLKTITVPQSVNHIGDNAFWDCPELSQAHVLNSQAHIGLHAFGNCPLLLSGYTAPGFPEDNSPPAQLLYSLLWCSCPDRHTPDTTAKAEQFIQSHEDLIMERILKNNNVPAMTGLSTRHLLTPEHLDGYLRQALELGLTEITALLLAAKGTGPSLDDDAFEL